MSDASVPQQPAPHTSGLAIASLVLSCLGISCVPCSVLGIVCGHLARSQIRKDPNFTGGGIALAGLIVGYGFLVFVVVAMLAFVFLPILLQQMH